MANSTQLQEYLNTLQNNHGDSVEHVNLVAAINTLLFYTESLRVPDAYGRIPYVTAKDRQSLMDMHKNIAEKADAILGSNDETAEVKDLVRKISALSSASFAQFSAYDPEVKRKSVDTIEEEVRMLNVDLRGTPDPERMGANMSSRQVLSFMDENGKVITGLFTPKKQVNSYQEIKNLCDELSKKAPTETGKELLEKLYDSARAKYGLAPNQNNDMLLDMLNRTQKKEVVNGKERLSMKEIDAERLAEYIAHVSSHDGKKYTKEDVINEVGAGNLAEFAAKLAGHIGNIGINIGNGALPDNSRTDNRNAAMSAVADILGVPHLLARSRPMKVTDQNGNEIEGTFMMEGKGLDYNRPSSECAFIDSDSLRDTDGRGFKALADLQVLDYICGNVDRHPGNMLYQFDEDQHFIGVQGIDNDCSFGRAVPTTKNRSRLAAPKDMLVVSESMYKKIMNMKPSELVYALSGYGLSGSELSAAARRLTTLQKELTAGKEYYDKNDPEDKNAKKDEELPPLKLVPEKVRIVPDDQFNRFTPDHVTREERRGNKDNIFGQACFAVKNMGRQYDFTNKRIQGKVVIGAENRSFTSEQIKAKNQAHHVVDLLDKKTHWYNSSRNYRDMEKAAAEYEKFQKQLQERIRLANLPKVKAKKDYRLDMEAIVTPEDLEKMRVLSEKLEKATEKYLNGKLGNGQKLEDYGKYTKERIAAAQETLKVARANKVIKPYEKEAAEINARRAKEAKARRLGDLQEAKDIKKGIVKKNEPPKEDVIKI